MNKRNAFLFALLVVLLYLAAGIALSYRALGWAAAFLAASFILTGAGFALKRKP